MGLQEAAGAVDAAFFIQRHADRGSHICHHHQCLGHPGQLSALHQRSILRFQCHLLTTGMQCFHAMGRPHGIAHHDRVNLACADFTVCILPLQVVRQVS